MFSKKNDYVIDFASLSDKGDREVNEDSIGSSIVSDNYCFALCDGLGGHGMGDVASSIAVQVITNQFSTANSIKEYIDNVLQVANDIITAEQIKQRAVNKMKTTAVVVSLFDNKIYGCHLGDSRAYVFKKDYTYVRTLDHSVPQMLVLTKQIEESEIRNHPDRTSVLRALGAQTEEPIRIGLIKPIKFNSARAVLLCSDGFWELIEEDDMIECLKQSETADEWLNKMLDIVKKNGESVEMDNYSAITILINRE